MHTKDERAAKLVLMGVFLSAAAVVGFTQQLAAWSWLDWLMFGAAVYRTGRMIAFELIMEPLRAPFCVTAPHPYSGMTTEPRYESGWRRSVGELLTCPICAGTWSAAILLYGSVLLPGPFAVVVRILAVVGVAELLHEATEALCWSAARNRRDS